MCNYLTNELCSFKTDWTFDDPSCSTSEIKPIRLQIPKKFLSSLPPPNPYELSATVQPLLASRKPLIKRNISPEKPQTRKTNSPGNNTIDSVADIPEPQTIEQNPLLESISGGPNIQHKTPIDVYLPFKCDNKQAKLKLFINGNTVECHTLESGPLFQSQFTDNGFDVTDARNGNHLASLKTMLYTREETIYFLVAERDGSKFELCSIQITNAYLSNNVHYCFNLYLPRILKRDGSIFPQDFKASNDSSVLFTQFLNGKKPTLLVTRMPEKSGKSFDMTFGGKLKTNSIRNCIVYFKQRDNDLLLFQLDENGTAATLDFCYPMCPLQAFAVAMFVLSPR